MLKDAWAAATFGMIIFKETQVPLLNMPEDTLLQLDSDVISLNTIIRNRFNHFHKKASEWVSTLATLSNIMKQLHTCQRLWSLLQTLYESEEIRQTLVMESKVWREADSTLQALLNRLWKVRIAIRVAKEQGLIPKLETLQVTLESCKKAIW